MLWRLFLLSFALFNTLIAREVILYVNSPLPEEITTQRWQPTIDLLNQNIPEHTFKLLPIKPSEVEKISSLLTQKKIDFLITQPAITTILKYSNNISIMLTMVTKYNMDQFGSLFLTKNTSPINTLEEIKGRKLAAVAPMSFGGWLAGYSDLFDMGIDPIADGNVIFCDGNHKSVIDKVLAGEVEVGVVKTGMIEQLSEAGLLDMTKIKVLNDKGLYPVKVSSTLYPEWSLSQAEHTDMSLSNRVFTVFTSIQVDSNAAIRGQYSQWHLPQSHTNVDAIFKKFRFGHYKDMPNYDITVILLTAIISIIITVVLGTLITLFLKNRYLLKLKNDLELELKKKEEILKCQSRMAAMGDMVGMIAHQWRQPLANVTMNVNNILLDYELGEIECESTSENLKNILTDAKYLSEIIYNFEKIFEPAKKSELISIQSVIERAIETYNPLLEKANIAIQTDFEEIEKHKIYTNELLQVLLILLQNSYEAFERNLHEDKIIQIKLYKDEQIHISIEDNAGGIPEDIVDKIFEPYFTTKDNLNGGGLGLYIARTLIQNNFFGSVIASKTLNGLKITMTFPAH